MIPRNAALFLGVIFIVVGVLGFVDNPVVGRDAAIITDQFHDVVHIVSGIILLALSLVRAETTRIAILVFGFVYLLLGLYGLISIGAEGRGQVMGMAVNGNTNLFHVGIGVVILIFGITSRRQIV